jgi:Family of unknown function (DUF6232)
MDTPMQEAFLFNNEDVSVTERVARFGAISYQVSNIGSVAVYYERKLSTFAIFLFVAGLLGAAIAYFLYQEPQLRDYTIYAAGASAALILFSIFLQHMWPVYEYKFVLKTASNDEHAIVSRDRDMVFRLKAALEEAFARRPMGNRTETVA